MTTRLSTSRPARTDAPAVSPSPRRRLTFSPLAWLKLQFLCHAGPTEVAAFGLAAEDDPLYLDDVLVVRQRGTPVTVAFDDEAVADLFDRMVDQGIPPERFARVWLHTHPGGSVEPSGTDEETFRRVFGGCDWAVMAILSRAGATSARLTFNSGPGGSLTLPVHVDWAAWPATAHLLAGRVASWRQEYAERVESTTRDWPDELRRWCDPSGDALPDDPFRNPFLPGETHAFE